MKILRIYVQCKNSVDMNAIDYCNIYMYSEIKLID